MSLLSFILGFICRLVILSNEIWLRTFNSSVGYYNLYSYDLFVNIQMCIIRLHDSKRHFFLKYLYKVLVDNKKLIIKTVWFNILNCHFLQPIVIVLPKNSTRDQNIH